MSRISSTGITTSSGLVSGIPIEDTVDQLMAISARPLNTLQSRNQGLAAERAAIDSLSSLTLGVQFSLSQLRSATVFNARSAKSSDSAALTATVASGQSPPAGSYNFTPIRQATPHQLVSARLEDLSSLGDTALSFGFGGHVDKGIELSELTGGFDGGKIKITDRDGQTAVVDLRGAQTVDDVLAAINEAAEVDVTASISGDAFVLTDLTGGDGTLRVREVSGGDTAESLGLLGTGVGDVLTGADVYDLTTSTELQGLNDGLGVRFDSGAEGDLRITLADGSTADIDLSDATTLGDVIDTLNDAEDLGGGLVATLNAEGDGLTLTDSTSGAGSLVVEDLGDGSVATDLGIATDGVAGSLDGRRLVAGLKDTLVSSLNAGAGFELGEIDITDRAGGTATVDLSSAETLGDLVDLINNAAGADVSASINSARNGLEITDESGGTGSLVIANGSSGTTADDLGVAVDAAAASVDSGSLGRQTVGHATLLEDFNGGKGVRLANIRLTDSEGFSSTITLTGSDPATTIGDVIDRINGSGLAVEARINDTGDGVLLTDTGDGDGVLSVEEAGSGNAAADLGLLGDSTTTDGSDRQIIDGSTRTTIDLSGITNSPEGTTLASLNGGEGVQLGLFEVVSKSGDSIIVDLTDPDAETIGDVVDRINQAAEGTTISARVNDSQSGIVIEDSSAADGELTVNELGSGATAADLNLIRTAADTDDAAIDGGGLFTYNGDNALQALADRINQAEAGVSASVFPDGDGFRLSITTDDAGAANELLVDGLGSALSFTETVRAGDAVTLFGSVAGIGGFALTSEDGSFDDIVEGLNVTVNQASGEEVTVDVTANPTNVVNAVKGFVAAYNSLRGNIAAVTDFDAESETTGILFGRSEVVRVDSELSRLLTDRYFVDGSVDTLQEIGVRVNSEGELELDESQLRDVLESSPGDVEELFQNEERGVLAKLDAVIDQLAGEENSLLSSRSDAITRTIESNEQRISDMSLQLDRQRENMLLEFIALEETIALLQSNVDYLDSIQPISIAASN